MARRSVDRDTNGIITALIYSRVSSDEQAKEGLSLPAQLQACRRYAADHSWIIGNEFQDVLAGTRDDRVAYQQLLTEARRLSAEGKRVAVVVMRLDRFGRRLPERIRSREELKKLSVSTHSVREGGEVSDLMANMLAVMAQEEVERLGDRVRDTREHNQQSGWHLPGRAPWGFKLRPATEAERAAGAPKSVLVPDEQTADYVKECFRMVAAGTPPAQVAVWVAGLPDEARGLVKTAKAGDGAMRPRTLNPAAVRLLLGATVYVGRFDDGSAGRWEPLIDQGTWDAVQARLTARRGTRGPVTTDHLLSGLLRCPKCGGRMTGWTVRGRWKRYRCNESVKGGEATVANCRFTLAARQLDPLVVEEVARLTKPLAADARIRRALVKAWDELRSPSDAAGLMRRRLRAAAERDVQDAKRWIGDAARLLVDGVLDREAYSALAEQEQRRLSAAERQLEQPEDEAQAAALPPLTVVLERLGGWQAALAGPVVAQRDVLAALVQTVTPEQEQDGWAVRISWTPLAVAIRTTMTPA